jgi:hypothetical protein
MSDLPGTVPDFAWSLQRRVTAAMTKPLEDLRATLQRAATPPELVAAADPTHFQRACMVGLAAVTDIALDDKLPAPVRTALRLLPQRYQELLTMLQPASQALATAGPDLRNVQHVDGMSAVLFQATQVANPSTPVGVAAIGGATLGTLVLPGIGTAIGGALGVLLGGSQANKRDRRALERFAAGVKMMWAATDDLHNGLWNQLVHAVQTAGGPTLPDAAFFETADAHWESVKMAPQTAVPFPGLQAPFRPAVEAYLRDWGPHPEALYVATQVCLPPFPLDLEALVPIAARLAALYPNDPHAHETSARLALEQGDFARALDAADRGLNRASQQEGLRHARLEALAALGRVAEAEEAVRIARSANPSVPPELALIRGLLRGGRRAEAIERVRAWVHRDAKPAWIVQQLSGFPLTASLLAESALSELLAVPAGKAGQLQAAVERHLRADGAKSFFGEPPGVKGHNAREAFLHLQPGEKVLFFHDWSLWHNAKTGLALTTQRVLWKSGWQDSVEVQLSATSGTPIKAEGSVLHVGGRSVDVENEGLAAGLAQVLQEADAPYRAAP